MRPRQHGLGQVRPDLLTIQGLMDFPRFAHPVLPGVYIQGKGLSHSQSQCKLQRAALTLPWRPSIRSGVRRPIAQHGHWVRSTAPLPRQITRSNLPDLKTNSRRATMVPTWMIAQTAIRNASYKIRLVGDAEYELVVIPCELGVT